MSELASLNKKAAIAALLPVLVATAREWLSNRQVDARMLYFETRRYQEDDADPFKRQDKQNNA